jgi:hypothetical protein
MRVLATSAQGRAFCVMVTSGLRFPTSGAVGEGTTERPSLICNGKVFYCVVALYGMDGQPARRKTSQANRTYGQYSPFNVPFANGAKETKQGLNSEF